MSVTVNVSLLSGKTAPLEVALDDPLETLKRRAEAALSAGRGRLLNSSGDVLDGATTAKRVKLQDGDVLTLQVRKSQIQGASRFLAFAVILGDGCVVTTGVQFDGKLKRHDLERPLVPLFWS